MLSTGMTREPNNRLREVSVSDCSGMPSPIRTVSTAMARRACPWSSASRIRICRAVPSDSVETFTWPTAAAARSMAGSGSSQLVGPPATGGAASCAATTTFPACCMERASALSSASVVGSAYKTSKAIALGCAAAIASMARELRERDHGKRPKRAMLGSSMATMAMSAGAGSGPRARISQSRAYRSTPGARQSTSVPMSAETTTMAPSEATLAQFPLTLFLAFCGPQGSGAVNFSPPIQSSPLRDDCPISGTARLTATRIELPSRCSFQTPLPGRAK